MGWIAPSGCLALAMCVAAAAAAVVEEERARGIPCRVDE